MSHFADVTGRWVGHYLQYGRESPISADLVQTGERLDGAMVDGVLVKELTIYEAAAAAGLPPGSDEAIEAWLRQQHPEAPNGRITLTTELPKHSILEGSRVGSIIRFLKSYQGAQINRHKIGDTNVEESRIERHVVHYEGKLSADGETIEGGWRIDANSVRMTSGCNGLFVLRRSVESIRAATKSEQKLGWEL
jgi:hypothetical protein